MWVYVEAFSFIKDRDVKAALAKTELDTDSAVEAVRVALSIEAARFKSWILRRLRFVAIAIAVAGAAYFAGPHLDGALSAIVGLGMPDAIGVPVGIVVALIYGLLKILPYLALLGAATFAIICAVNGLFFGLHRLSVGETLSAATAEPEAVDARLDLLAKLRVYGREYPEEEAVVSRFEAFVKAHDDAFLRSCESGHVTGSAFIVDPAMAKTLLVHHRKLDKWLQPGGHCEAGETALDAARREAREETGLDAVPASPGRILDLDVHGFPARGDVPAHFHYDVRFLLVAEAVDASVSEESRAVEWMGFDEARRRNSEDSIARMIRKSTRST